MYLRAWNTPQAIAEIYGIPSQTIIDIIEKFAGKIMSPDKYNSNKKSNKCKLFVYWGILNINVNIRLLSKF